MSTLYMPPRRNNDLQKILFLLMILCGLLFLMALWSGCNTEKHFQKQAAEHPDWLKQSDSTWTAKVDTVYKPKPYSVTVKGNDIYHDSLIPVPGPCPDKIKGVTNKGASLKISEKNNVQVDTCRCDSLQGVVLIMQAEINKLIKEKIVKVIPPKQPNWFEKAWDSYKNGCTWIVSIFLALITIYTGGRAFNFLPKIPKFPF